MTTNTTRAEHVAWCKERALEYVDLGMLSEALSSLFSDLRKHPATADHAAVELGTMLAVTGHMTTAAEVREFIEGVQ